MQSMLTQTLAEPQCSLQPAVACVGIGKGTTVAPALYPVLGVGIVLRSDSRLPELLRKSLTRPALPAALVAALCQARQGCCWERCLLTGKPLLFLIIF